MPHYTSCLINHADTFEGCDTKQLCGPTTELFQQVGNQPRLVDVGRFGCWLDSKVMEPEILESKE